MSGEGASLPISGRSIVCLSSIDWGFLWQGHQEITTRLAAAGNHVVFVENTGARSLRPSDLPRIVSRLRSWLIERTVAKRHPVPDMTLVAPLLLPFPRSRVARSMNERWLLPRLATRIKASLVGDPIILTFLPTQNALGLIELLAGPASTVVYCCFADFRELSDLGPMIAASERAVVERADVIFVNSESFVPRFRPLNPNVHYLRLGVNLEIFDPARVAGSPRELAGLPRPIIGYSGGLHRHVDFGLVGNVARAFPEASVVLVGPLQTDPGELRAEPNVHLLGPRPQRDLAAFVAAFDVGLVPYVRTAYTDSVYPMKLFEYLAMGRPVVATDLPELRTLGLPVTALRIAHDGDEFVREVRAAISHRDGDLAGQRRALALQRDWGVIIREMSAIVASAKR